MAPFIFPGSYVFRGSYFRADSMIPHPIEGRFEASFAGGRLVLDGTWQQHSGRPKSAFKFESDCDVDGFLAPISALISPHQLNGWAATIPDGFSALANDAAQNAVSIHVTRTKDRVHTAKGQLLRIGARPVAFEILVGPAESELALENVVALRPGKER